MLCFCNTPRARYQHSEQLQGSGSANDFEEQLNAVSFGKYVHEDIVKPIISRRMIHALRKNPLLIGGRGQNPTKLTGLEEKKTKETQRFFWFAAT
nr:hypothetical protein CFP56_71275 [Quercus suber]